MPELFEQEQDVVSTESSPADNNEANAENASNQQSQTEQQTQTAESQPFHEHPRFKELVEQKNQFARESQELRRAYQDMQNRFSQMEKTRSEAQKREDALHARLKGIDPEFGERFAKLDSSLEELQELKAWKAEQEVERVRQSGISYVNSQHESNKVPAEWRDIYNSQIEAAIRSNPRATLQDLPSIYQSVHATMKKLTEGMKRADREAYVTDKKADAKAPTSGKGQAATPGKKGMEWSKDPEQARRQMVAEIRKQIHSDE